MVRPVVQLFLLLLAIPAQYLITLWGSQSSDATSMKVRKLVTNFKEFCNNWFKPQTWLDESKKLWFYLTDDRGECVAVEVMKYRSDVGYFGNNPEPRLVRPVKVKYRIGQVFRHKSMGYHGIIIGWDEHARAPDSWLVNNYGSAAIEKQLEPHYAVLPDESENDKIQMYISQDDIEIVTSKKIENEVINDYFEVFDHAVYQARPFLKQLYPND